MRGKDSAALDKGVENKVLAFKLKSIVGFSAHGHDML
jgi:hypothetical protein